MQLANIHTEQSIRHVLCPVKYLCYLIYYLYATKIFFMLFFILFYLRKPIRKFLADIIEVNFKAGPIETTARRENRIVAAASLAAATTHWEETERLHFNA